MLSTSTTTTTTNHHRQVHAIMHGGGGGGGEADAASAASAAAANAIAALALQGQQQQQQQQSQQRQPLPIKKKTGLFFHHHFSLKSLLHLPNNNNNNSKPKSGGVLRLAASTTSRGKSNSSSSSKRRSASLRHHASSTLTAEFAESALLSSSNSCTLAVDTGGTAAAAAAAVVPAPPLNVMHWLETTCPADLLPSILAYCGPQKTAMLGRTNRHWKALVFDNDGGDGDAEATWRVLCQDLYKWKEGDEEPASWRAHYRQNPCVPIDYSTVQAALQLAAPRVTHHHHKNTQQLKQVRSLKIWMRPGRYHLKQAIQVQAPPGVELVIETMQLPANIFQKPLNSCSSNTPQVVVEQQQAAEQPLRQRGCAPRRSSSSSSNSNPFLQFIRRGSSRSSSATAAAIAAHFEETEPTERSESSNNGGVGGAAAASDVVEVFGRQQESLHHQHEQQQQRAVVAPQETHATLVLQTRRHNEPALRVLQGKVTLTNVEIEHFAHGLDIWNGNAAIQVQPPLGNNDVPLRLEPRPTAILQGCKVTSSSGRGIVNIDGGHVTIRQCAIYNCAATGVYIGGPGSQATLQDSDIVRNGVGNHHPTTTGSSRRGGAGRGIARGHSGVYLEQGSAHIDNCNISENTLTGISAVSPDNAILHLTDTSLVGNGTFQLELPSVGSNARDQSRLDNNQLSTQGSGRVRSGLLPATAVSLTTTTTTNEPATATMRG